MVQPLYLKHLNGDPNHSETQDFQKKEIYQASYKKKNKLEMLVR